MPQPGQRSTLHLIEVPTAHVEDFSHPNPREPRAPVGSTGGEAHRDPLLTAEDVAQRLNVSKDWVWDHSSRKAPYLPVIRMGDGTLRYRSSGIEAFITERERLSALRSGRR
jgi:predicted DNA-binding transcriptional regulator AlpA